MITLPSKREEDLVISAIENWEDVTFSPTLIFDAGGEDYSDRIPTGDTAQDGIAITLEAAFAGNFPLDLYGAPVSLSVAINGVVVPMLEGIVNLPEPNDDRASTKMLAASVGSYADKHPLNQRVEYPGDSPAYVVRDALRRLPYPPGSVRVDNVEGPPIYAMMGRPGEGPFQPDQHVSDILSRVSAALGDAFIYRDLASGGHRAHISRGRTNTLDIPSHMRFREQDLLFWKSPTATLEQYARVVVDRQLQDGTSFFGDNVPYADVRYFRRKFPPPAGAIFRIPFTGDNPEDAWQIAYDKAHELGAGSFKNEPILPFNPLLERTDIFTVSEVKDEDGTFYEREWLHDVTAWEQDWSLDSSGGGFQTKTSCSVALLNEQAVKAPSLNLMLISGGVLKTLHDPVGIITPSLDENLVGLWFDDEIAIDEDGEPWIGVDENGGWIDPERSRGYAGHDADGFWFIVTVKSPSTPIGSTSLGFWFDDLYARNAGRPWVGVGPEGGWIDPENSRGAAGHDENGFWFNF